MMKRISKSAQVVNSAGGAPLQVSVIRRNSERATIRARNLALPLQFNMRFAGEDASWHQCQIVRQHGFVVTVRINTQQALMDGAASAPISYHVVKEGAAGEVMPGPQVGEPTQPCAARESVAGQSPDASKRSVSISGHKTSVRVPDSCWNDLCLIASDLGARPSQMVRMIDDEAHDNLSLAVREFVARYRDLQNRGDDSDRRLRTVVAGSRTRRRAE